VDTPVVTIVVRTNRSKNVNFSAAPAKNACVAATIRAACGAETAGTGSLTDISRGDVRA
jgi:hypothetical protein